ncbi:MAG: DUF4037 domain-containing protein [Anaerolineales bacterium]|nr:DUF4037 domain-containing protein [Anaerolineales bacterium]
MPNSTHPSLHIALARRVASHFQAFPQVEAIGLGGSQASQASDAASDIDLYVFTTALVPLHARQRIVDQLGASRADMNLDFWDLGDEWFDHDTGIEVDVIYWDLPWIEAQVVRVLDQHEASIGYSTCHWSTMRSMHILYDRNGWLRRMVEKCHSPYPEPLRQAIISRNHALLRGVIPAYTHQIEKAIQRSDLVSINHRLAALLASYFDVIFAFNRLPHPGEKRLVQKALAQCPLLPAQMAEQVDNVLRLAASPGRELVAAIQILLDNLDTLLAASRD